MLKKILTLVLSLLLIAVFYIYALLSEDVDARQPSPWTVAEEKAPLQSIGTVTATDSAALGRAMGSAAPLPASLSAGSVEDGSYHGYPVRLLHASAPGLSVRGVRPLSAAPLVRTTHVTYKPSGAALLGYPLIIAKDDTGFFYYMTTEDAAYEIRTQAQDEQSSLALLSTLTLIQP